MHATPRFVVRGRTVCRLTNGEAVFTIDGEEKTMTPRNKISDFNSLIGKAFPGSGKRALGGARWWRFGKGGPSQSQATRFSASRLTS
jgi:hypothetical protein